MLFTHSTALFVSLILSSPRLWVKLFHLLIISLWRTEPCCITTEHAEFTALGAERCSSIKHCLFLHVFLCMITAQPHFLLSFLTSDAFTDLWFAACERKQRCFYVWMSVHVLHAYTFIKNLCAKGEVKEALLIQKSTFILCVKSNSGVL